MVMKTMIGVCLVGFNVAKAKMIAWYILLISNNLLNLIKSLVGYRVCFIVLWDKKMKKSTIRRGDS